MSGYPVYVIQLALPGAVAMRLCIAVVLRWDTRNPQAPIPNGDVYYADGCPAQGFRFSVVQGIAIPSIRGYRGKTQVGSVQPHDLQRFYDLLATTDLSDGSNWALNALRRLRAHHLDIPIYGPEPVFKGLAEGRRAWEQGDD